MPTAYTSLIGLALPVTGELSGTWGDVVNAEITALLDSSIAGTTTLSTDADVTLTTTTGAANQARQASILCTGARTALRTITAPARSKIYVINNATTGGFDVKIVGVGPTTGVTVPAGVKALVAWNGSDFVRVASTQVSLTTEVTGTLPVANGGTGVTSSTGTGSVVLSTSPTLTTPDLGTPSALVLTNATGTPASLGLANATGTPTSINLTNGTSLPLTTGVTGTLPVANGGTGQTTYTNGQLLIGNTTGNTLTKATLTQGTGVTITNGSGAITISATGTGGTVTTASVVSANGFAGTVANATTTPAITLTTSITGVLKGNGTAISAATAGTDYVAPGTATTFTAAQSFTASGILLKGSSTGYTTFASANASATAYTITFPAATVTVASLTGIETFTNKTLTNPTFTGYTETVNATYTTALNPANGTIQRFALTGNTTFTNSLAAGQSITLMIDDGTAYTVTWPTMTWVGGAAPTLVTTGYTVVELWQVSTTLYGAFVGSVA